MLTENLSTLNIHKLTQEQYDRELESGNIDETALYLTPDEEVGVWHTVDIVPFDGTLKEFTSADDSKITKTLPVPIEPSKYNYEVQVITFGLNSVGASVGSNKAYPSVACIYLNGLDADTNPINIVNLSHTIELTGSQNLRFPTTNRVDGYLTGSVFTHTMYGRVYSSGELTGTIAPFESFSMKTFDNLENYTFDQVYLKWENYTFYTHQTYGVRFQYRAIERE